MTIGRGERAKIKTGSHKHYLVPGSKITVLGITDGMAMVHGLGIDGIPLIQYVSIECMTKE